MLEEHVYDVQGVRLASCHAEQHVRSTRPADATLPRHVEIQWPPAQLTISTGMADVTINQLSGDPQELFVKPSYSGYNEIDLAQPGGLVPVARPAAAAPPNAPAASGAYCGARRPALSARRLR